MSVSASSSAAIRRSRIPVRSRIHSSFVSTSFDELVVRQDALRHVAPEARDRDRLAVRTLPITPDHPLLRPTANVSVPRTASSPSTVAFAFPRPTGPRTRLDHALERQHVARAARRA